MPINLTAAFPFTDALYRSGLVVHVSDPTRNSPAIFQPAYDTWTTRYEGDGILQAERSGIRGVVRVPTTLREPWRSSVVDAGTDGIDNDVTGGVDDLAEAETSPPFPIKLRGLKIAIRMEDPVTRQVDQMSVAKEFVTQ
jgi:hypothetical protein